jgi:hypothetical protein
MERFRGKSSRGGEAMLMEILKRMSYTLLLETVGRSSCQNGIIGMCDTRGVTLVATIHVQYLYIVSTMVATVKTWFKLNFKFKFELI